MPPTSIVVTGGKKPSEILFSLKKDKPKKLWIVVALSVYLLNNTAVLLKIKNYFLFIEINPYLALFDDRLDLLDTQRRHCRIGKQR